MSTPPTPLSHDRPMDEPKPRADQQFPEQYPSPRKRIAIMAAVYLSIFLITLDQNIISTAIPRITDEFDSLDDIGWYGSAYILTTCSFQLLMGKVYKFYPAKPLFIGGIALFEIGSAVCGAAPSSTAFIIGRAIAGLGSSGLFSGAMVIMFHTIPLQQRPIYQGFGGAVFAIASVIGPLIGGTFTDKVTWRWCFYINLPIGAVAIMVVVIILHLPDQKLDDAASSFLAGLRQLDPVGNLVFFPGVICLILALQWGGSQYPWKDGRVIVLLTLCGILCLTFIGIQIWKKEGATVPPRLIKQRSIAAAIWFGFFNSIAMMVVLYYLPIWFQAIKDDSAIRSGIMLLPTILSSTFASLISGFLVSKLGYCNPLFIFSSIVTVIGAGLLTTFTPTTSPAKWIGYQVLFGFGLGCGIQQPMNVVQTVLDRSDIATGAAIVMFARFLGSAVFLPVAQNVVISRLISTLTNLPDINPVAVENGGATKIRLLATGNDLKTLISDYNTAIVDVFYMAVASSALTIVGSMLVEWRSLKARANEHVEKSPPETNNSV